MTYYAIFDRAGDGTIWGRIPEMLGAYGCGATIDEARESLIEGVRIYMEEMRKDGIEISISATLTVLPIHLDAG